MHTRIAVVGGGLAGLAAARICARAGREVCVFERASAVGGRCSTAEHAGYAFNQGLRALYRGGDAERLLRELEIPVHGTRPPTSGALLWDRGALLAMPVGFVTLASTGALPARSKLAAARILYLIDRGDVEVDIPDTSLSAFIEGVTTDAAIRRLLFAVFRIATYTRNAALVPARAAVRQLRRAAREGVLYLDRGWQQLVDGLKSGLVVHTSTGVTRVDGNTLSFDDGRRVTFDACILAVPPAVASRLTNIPLPATEPILASCLDIAVTMLPNPKHRFVVGLNGDEAFFFNVQSLVADLAPPAGALLSIIEYLKPNMRGTRDTLERVVDSLQPGWRDVAVHTQFLPKMVVAANHPGLPISPTLRHGASSAPIFGAGDGWGADMLLDGALGSARAAATMAIDATGHIDAGRCEAKVA